MGQKRAVATPAGDKQAAGAYPRRMHLCTQVGRGGQLTYASKIQGPDTEEGARVTEMRSG